MLVNELAEELSRAHQDVPVLLCDGSELKEVLHFERDAIILVFDNPPKSEGDIESPNSAEVKPVEGAQPPKREYNNRSDKIAWVEQAFFCKVNHQPNPKNVSLWMDRKNAVIAQLRAVR